MSEQAAPLAIRSRRARGHVKGNDWKALDAPELGGWEPTRSVSVVIPYYEAWDALQLTLAGLAEQTYPSGLLEVIITDDGSDPPAEMPSGFASLDIEVVYQEDRGFGLARARNLGARIARGDILVFLDCDMVPEPGHIEAHARWHHLVDDAVTIGFRRHVEFHGVGTEDIRSAARAGGLSNLFADREVQKLDWVESHMRRTSELTSNHDDLFRVASGGNLGVRRDVFFEVGGADESFTQWGAEDIELGFRYFTYGALFVPERAALCWHQGLGNEPDPEEKRSLEEQRAKIAHLIAHRGFRRSVPGRTFAVPRVLVTMPADGSSEEVMRSAETVLASRFHDLVLKIEVPDDHDHQDSVWLERQFGPDPRVFFDDGGEAERLRFAPIRIDLPGPVFVAEDLIGRIADALEDEEDPLGLLYLTVAGASRDDGLVRAYTARGINRARRLVDSDEEIDPAIGELFGERWASGRELGVFASEEELAVAVASRVKAEPRHRSQVPADVAEVGELAHGLDGRARSSALKASKRIVMLSQAIDRLANASSKAHLKYAIRDLLKALLPWSVFLHLRSLWSRLRGS